MNASHANELKPLAHAAAELRRRDLEVMANFRAFPWGLWSEAKNRDIAIAQRQVGQSFRDIRSSAAEERKSIPFHSDLHGLAEAICDYADGGAEVAASYVKLAEFMDAYSVRRPLYALYHGLRWTRVIAKIEKRMDDAARRIKLLWPVE